MLVPRTNADRLRALRLSLAGCATGLLVLAAAVAGRAGPPTPSPAFATAGVQLPAPSVAGPQQQATVVQEAFDLLMDDYVSPLSSADLLGAAWAQLVQEAAGHQLPVPSLPPVLTGDRAADIAAFRSALLAYLAAQPSLPDEFVAAHAAVRGMVAYCDEQHTQFLDPQAYQRYLAWSRADSSYAGIGVRLKGAQRTITEVYAGGPAERAGLLPGDAVLEVNGTSVEQMTAGDTSDLIRGPAGSPVELVVRRHGAASPIRVSLSRQSIAVDFVRERLLDDAIGYVSLRGFPPDAVADTFEHDLADLQARGARGLVLDLRDNGGGRLTVGSRLLGHFLPAGARLYQEIDRSGGLDTPTAAESQRYALPLVVLVNEATASMGEIFAAALQEHGVATVVGSTTAGDVARAQMHPLTDGSALMVTEMEVRSPAGKVLNKVGVVPDDVVVVDPAATLPGVDPVLDEAVIILRQRATPAAGSLVAGDAHALIRTAF
jgi:carboxyl-terminal processing protease